MLKTPLEQICNLLPDNLGFVIPVNIPITLSDGK
jgi:hypothetical protein